MGRITNGFEKDNEGEIVIWLEGVGTYSKQQPKVHRGIGVQEVDLPIQHTFYITQLCHLVGTAIWIRRMPLAGEQAYIPGWRRW